MNYNYMLTLMELFDRHGGFWDINKSEEDNLEIKWSPFVFDSNGRSFDLFNKRVYCIKDFYNMCVRVLNNYLPEGSKEMEII